LDRSDNHQASGKPLMARARSDRIDMAALVPATDPNSRVGRGTRTMDMTFGPDVLSWTAKPQRRRSGGAALNPRRRRRDEE
jgi:hypothetical protein